MKTLKQPLLTEDETTGLGGEKGKTLSTNLQPLGWFQALKTIACLGQRTLSQVAWVPFVAATDWQFDLGQVT